MVSVETAKNTVSVFLLRKRGAVSPFQTLTLELYDIFTSWRHLRFCVTHSTDFSAISLPVVLIPCQDVITDRDEVDGSAESSAIFYCEYWIFYLPFSIIQFPTGF